MVQAQAAYIAGGLPFEGAGLDLIRHKETRSSVGNRAYAQSRTTGSLKDFMIQIQLRLFTPESLHEQNAMENLSGC